jgi:hypothetical protein
MLSRFRCLAATKFDASFRDIVSAGWAEKSTGTVESALGHLAFVPISAEDLRTDVQGSLWEAVFMDWPELPVPEPGFYLVREDDAGFVFVHEYATRLEAERDFADFEKESDKWFDEDDPTPTMHGEYWER